MSSPLCNARLSTQGQPVKESLENFKALSQKTLTPLLQQGFSKARTEQERGSFNGLPQLLQPLNRRRRFALGTRHVLPRQHLRWNSEAWQEGQAP